MGSTPQTSGGTTVVNQTTTPTPTAEETALNQRNLRIAQATEGGQTTMQQNALALGNQLLTGGTDMLGYFQKMMAGIDANTMGHQASRFVTGAMPGMQQSGLTNSGTAARSIAKGVASEVQMPAETFNIGSWQNALNLALSGQAQVQAPIQANASSLATSLAGLRSVNTSGTTSTTGWKGQTGMNLGFLGSWGGSY